MHTHKKIITIVLLLTMCLSLTACGSGGNTKDELLSAAEELDIAILSEEVNTNFARAEQNYIGKSVILSGYVSGINSDYCTLECSIPKDEFTTQTAYISAYLSHDELTQLEKGNRISVVGKISEITNTQPTNVTLETAYFHETVFEYSGILTVKTTWMEYYDASGRIQHTGSRNEWIHYFSDDKGNTFRLLAADAVTKNGELFILGQTYKNGDAITVVGSQFYEYVSSNTRQYYMNVDSIELNE